MPFDAAAPLRGGFTHETTFLTQEQMRAELAQQVMAAGGVRAFCRCKGFESHAAVSLALSGGREVSEWIANCFGYLKVDVFWRPGFTNETTYSTQAQVRAELARQVMAEGGARAFCRRKGIESHAAVSLALSGKREVSEGIANCLGYVKLTVFRKMDQRNGG